MRRPTTQEYLDHLAAESRRFRDTLAGCAPDAVVPSCPEWTATDLLRHLAHVQAFWAWVVGHRPDGPEAFEDPALPEGHTDLLAAFDRHSAALTDALRAADPAEAAWTWHDTRKDVAFVLRRQAHEALVHRRDAELAAGALSPFPPDLAADGVDEALDVMFGGCPPWGTFTPGPRHVRVDVTDTGDTVWVVLGRFTGTSPDGEVCDDDDVHVVADPGVPPSAVLAGTAEALDTALWRRADWTAVTASGDASTIAVLRSVVDQPIR